MKRLASREKGSVSMRQRRWSLATSTADDADLVPLFVAAVSAEWGRAPFLWSGMGARGGLWAWDLLRALPDGGYSRPRPELVAWASLGVEERPCVLALVLERVLISLHLFVRCGHRCLDK